MWLRNNKQVSVVWKVMFVYLSDKVKQQKILNIAQDKFVSDISEFFANINWQQIIKNIRN